MAIVIAGCGTPQSAPISGSGDGSGIVLTSAGGSIPGQVTGKRKYTLAVSIYAGWMPWYYANEAGILKKWADAQGIEIRVIPMDYIGSIEAYVAGRADACLMTNMEALDLPAATGIDTTVLIIGDYSNGNDKILTRGVGSVTDLQGVQVSLVELSVSDYLLNRALEGAGLSQQDLTMVNTADSKIAAEFISNKDIRAVVTWNPIAMEVEKEPGVRSIYDSSMIPGEILDLCVVNTQVVAADPRLGRALVGAWYEVLGQMQQDDAAGREALAKMAELGGCNLAEYQAQLRTTSMYWKPTAAVDYAESTELKRNMDSVRRFCFAKKLLGDYASSADTVGIVFPDGEVQGARENVKLRFDASFMRAAR